MHGWLLLAQLEICTTVFQIGQMHDVVELVMYAYIPGITCLKISPDYSILNSVMMVVTNANAHIIKLVSKVGNHQELGLSYCRTK